MLNHNYDKHKIKVSKIKTFQINASQRSKEKETHASTTAYLCITLYFQKASNPTWFARATLKRIGREIFITFAFLYVSFFSFEAIWYHLINYISLWVIYDRKSEWYIRYVVSEPILLRIYITTQLGAHVASSQWMNEWFGVVCRNGLQRNARSFVVVCFSLFPFLLSRHFDVIYMSLWSEKFYISDKCINSDFFFFLAKVILSLLIKFSVFYYW